MLKFGTSMMSYLKLLYIYIVSYFVFMLGYDNFDDIGKKQQHYIRSLSLATEEKNASHILSKLSSLSAGFLVGAPCVVLMEITSTTADLATNTNSVFLDRMVTNDLSQLYIQIKQHPQI